MKCAKCGSERAEGVIFCAWCGTQSEDAPAQVQQPGHGSTAPGQTSSAPVQNGQPPYQQPPAYGQAPYYQPPPPYGQPQYPYQPPFMPVQQPRQLNSFGLAGFILGIISWFLNFWGIVGTMAIVFSAISLANFDKTREYNFWMPIVGLVSGIINVFYAIMVLVL